MLDGRSRFEWEHTSYVLWMLYTVNRGEKSPQMKPENWNPYTPENKSKPAKVKITDLKGLFVRDGGETVKGEKLKDGSDSTGH